MKIEISNKICITGVVEDEYFSITQYLTFLNPKYEEALQFGRSVRSIPQYLELFEYSDCVLTVPIGTLDYLVRTFKPEIRDQRKTVNVSIPFLGELRPYQSEFVDVAINAKGGQMIAATGSGKTVSGIALAAQLKQRTLILVKSKDLAIQWIEAIQQFTGLDAGLIGAGKNTEGAEFTIGLTQTLSKRDLSDFNYGLVIADECHNLPANQAYKVMNGLDCKFKYGLSATPNRRDKMEFMIDAAVGPICSEINQNQLLGNVLPVRITTTEEAFYGDVDSWADFMNVLVDDKSRNNMIVTRAIQSSKKMGTIVLCSQVRHCELLFSLCIQLDTKPLVLHGQLTAKVRAERMAQAPDAALIIGTLSLLSEGIDLPHLSALIFAAPVSASLDKENPTATRLIQSIGRCRRPFKGKSQADVLDIIDNHPFGMSAYRKRYEIYRQQGFMVR